MKPSFSSVFNILIPYFSIFKALFSKFNSRLKWQHVSLSSTLMIAVLFISSCQSTSQKANAGLQEDSSFIIVLPKPQPISKAEAERINKACQLWYDSRLLLKGFNGGIIVAENGNIVFEKYSGTGHIPGNDIITANTSRTTKKIMKPKKTQKIKKIKFKKNRNLSLPQS